MTSKVSGRDVRLESLRSLFKNCETMISVPTTTGIVADDER
jgi:hypothetical protein